MPSTKRRVVLCKHVAPGRWRGGPVRLWAFGYGDLADALGVTRDTVRRMIRDDRLDPADLSSICRAANAPGRRKEQP